MFYDEKERTNSLSEELLNKDELASKQSNYINEKIENWKRFYFKLTTGSISGSIFCLLCLSFGSGRTFQLILTGILALPYSFVKLGFILGSILFAIASFCTIWTSYLLNKVAFRENTINYSYLIYKFYGQRQVYIYELMNLINNFGAIIVYQQIISNFILSFLKFCNFSYVYTHYELTRFAQMFLFGILTQVPVSAVRNIFILHKMSMYGTLALLYTILVTVIESPFLFQRNYSYNRIKFFDFNENVFKFICLYFFSFANHNAVLNVINEIKEPTKRKAIKIIKYSFTVEVVTYILVLFSGYFSTFDETKELYVDREDQSIFLLLGKVFYTVSLTCHIGLFCFISKPSVEMLINNNKQFSEYQNKLLIFTLIISLNIIAYLFTSISNIISIVGASANVYYVFLMPDHKPKRDWKRYLSIAILIFAVSVGFIFLSLITLLRFE